MPVGTLHCQCQCMLLRDCRVDRCADPRSLAKLPHAFLGVNATAYQTTERGVSVLCGS